MAEEPGVPRGVWLTAAFFAASGVLDAVTSLLESPHPIPFLKLWDILGRGFIHFVIAFGLWHRIALCRSIALVYCLAALVTYGFALGLAFADAPLRFPISIVVQSAFEIPSCALLIPFLRSDRAAVLFTRPLLGR
jgi:hypothetical protein